MWKSAGAAVAATVLGGALTVGTGVSSAAATTNTEYDLYCYANQTGGNGFRFNYFGGRDNIGGGDFNYFGIGIFQQWDGRQYVAVRNQQVIQIGGVGASGSDANAVCRAISGRYQNGYLYGNFG